ncbi:MAG: hypothetical protein AB7G88_01935 [Thermomicrobiales bacterium]
MDEDCCDDLQCVHGKCDKHPVCAGEKVACDEKTPCCKGYHCVDGSCKPKKRPHPPKDEGDGTESVEKLPSTGSGPQSGSSEWIGAVLAGGAAAAAGAWLIRESDEQAHPGA